MIFERVFSDFAPFKITVITAEFYHYSVRFILIYVFYEGFFTIIYCCAEFRHVFHVAVYIFFHKVDKTIFKKDVSAFCFIVNKTPYTHHNIPKARL